MMYAWIAISFGLGISMSGIHPQEDLHGAESMFFREQVWSILEEECLRCHGADPERIRGGFRIDSRESILTGGDRGNAFKEATPSESLLLKMVSWSDEDHQMPPSGRLSDDKLALIQEWVLSGIPWAEGVGDATATIKQVDVAIGGNWWAWQSLDKQTPPKPLTSWPLNPIDQYIYSGLISKGLKPAPEATKSELIRRVTYDLTGLPPTPEEVEKFIADESEDAYEHLVDRLLESEQHGVRWGRHWLDVVRFAETDGYERDRVKPSAWKYRDWVVNAINEDMGWDTFLTHQLAGDEIKDRDVDSLIATGFYRLGIWDDEPTDVLLAQYDDLDSIVDVTSRAMMGMSIQCARCHDHKRDPIRQTDYYRLASVFRTIKPYKSGGGNSLNPAHFVRSVPSYFGNESLGKELREEYTVNRNSILKDIQLIEETYLDPVTTRSNPDLFAHYAFEETSGSILNDSIGTTNGSIDGGRSFSEGHIDNSRYFDGDLGGRGIRIPHHVHRDFTISFWMKTTELGQGRDGDPRWFMGTGLVDGEISGIVDDLGISMIGNGIIAAGVGRPETFIHSTPGHNDGKWHHIALTRDTTSGKISLYVDGLHVDEAIGGTQPLNDPKYLSIGRMRTGRGAFTGQLDELSIYTRSLSDQEVAAIANGLLLDSSALNENAPKDEYVQKIESLLELEQPAPMLTDVLCAISKGPNPTKTNLLVRGNPHVIGRAVQPGSPAVLGADNFSSNPMPHKESPGIRRAFANWLTSDTNRVASRVAANRLWQHHFGRGIVRSSDDFGRLGDRPTHPQLLDWLATELVQRKWSMKEMHRLIVNSRTYRMSNTFDEEAFLKDPKNDAFWRFDMRRLSAEELRDSVLAVSGNLNLKIGGPSVYPPMPAAVLKTASRPNEAWGRSTAAQAGRRSLYVFSKRSLRFPFLEGFDQPDTDRPCSVRFATTVPTQSLMMLNSEFMNTQAHIMARRLSRERPRDIKGQIQLGLYLALGRPPTHDEIASIVELIDEIKAEDELNSMEALESACLLILNLNEFMHIK